ncbi:MAG: hypothetical protein CMP47_03050 [Rickettsiales bacterium]|nr:hypothetical protein [Rickettsiales bacterium]
MEMEVFTGVVDSWGRGIAFALPPPKVSEPGAPAMPAPAASSWRIRASQSKHLHLLNVLITRRSTQ